MKEVLKGRFSVDERWMEEFEDGWRAGAGYGVNGEPFVMFQPGLQVKRIVRL